MQANMTGRMSPRDLTTFDGTCVSMYLAGHKVGSGSRPMSVRLRALTSEAERVLEGRGVSAADRASLLEPLRALAGEPQMNAGQSDGLAVFRTSGRFAEVSLPWHGEDLLSVAEEPLLAPWLHAREKHGHFLLLALSKKNTRLLECDHLSHRELPLPGGLARGIDDFEGFDRPDRAQGQTGAGVKFGLETFAEKHQLYFHDYCRALDRALQPLLEQRCLPVVLAGTGSELAVYRSMSSSAWLAPEAVEGSPDSGWTGNELAEKGRAALRSWQSPDVARAVELYERSGPGKKSAEIEEILRAAASGRVMHLLLARGDYGAAANEAAVETWRHDGQVWSIEDGVDKSAIAAVFRW